jgi:hypothetical protein
LRRVPRYWSDLRENRRRVMNRRKANDRVKNSLDMSRTFTVSEAETLLPILESLLRSAMQAKQLIEEVDTEMQSLSNRIFLNGGTRVDIVSVARRKAEREKAVQRAKDAVAEIDATGVQVKDLDIGLLDFPCVVGEEVILLCWKLGEKKISHWHNTQEGFAGRKPIDERILRGQKKSN